VFSALPIDQGLSLFLLHQHDWFSRQFSQRNKTKLSKGTNIIPESKQIALSFIQSRDELMNLSSGEIDHAKHSIDLLRSGGEIPASVMLSLVEAKKRNVTTRMLIQDYSAANASQVDNWKQNGILVKKTTLRHVRLMLYDSSVVYFMSYRNEDSVKDLGMKITYPPFATILSQLFHEWWEKGEKV
jgi:sugar-specific transcriptional regulator TrmB